jgi:hypothetical protein
MRIDKAGEDDFAGAVDLGNTLSIFLNPGIALRVFCGAHRNYLAAMAEHGSVWNDAEFLKIPSATWDSLRSQREELANVQQQQRIVSGPAQWSFARLKQELAELRSTDG